MLRVYLGIDPGENGAIAAMYCREAMDGEGYWRPTWDFLSFRNYTEAVAWKWLSSFREVEELETHAIIEQQIPRPTKFFDHTLKCWKTSILKSTCLLYGRYAQLKAFLLAAGISTEEVVPQTWQKEFSLKRLPAETDSKWKNRLKAKAEQLFPIEKITLATSDAMLLAEYCRRRHKEG